MLTRRALLAAFSGAALDPERLLWQPGAKLISIPRECRSLHSNLLSESSYLNVDSLVRELTRLREMAAVCGYRLHV
jgi:hypothetical protein